jgi:hypothetical protein
VAGTTRISTAMLDARGRCYERAESLPVSVSDIRRWAIAVYHPEVPPRLFWDEEHARHSVHGGIVAPEEFNPFAWITRDRPVTHSTDVPRGGFIERALGIEPPDLRHDLFGGVEIEYGGRIRPGDVIHSRSVLLDYWERDGRLGLMLFTAAEVRWTRGRGELVKLQRNVYIRY